MSKLNVEQVETFPPLVRGAAARNSEEREQIQNLLSQIGVAHKVNDIPSEREYNSLQQRIRGIAKVMGVKVSIQWAKKENALYFRSENVDTVIEAEAAAPKTRSKK